MSLTNLNYSIYLLTTFAQCVAILILNTASASFGVSARKTIATDKGKDSPGPIYEPEDLDALGKEGRPGASFGVGPAHMPPGLNLSPFINYDNHPVADEW